MSNRNRFSLYYDSTSNRRYLILDPNNIDFAINEDTRGRLCDPHFGIGADELLLTTDFKAKSLPEGFYILRDAQLSSGIMDDDSINPQKFMAILRKKV